ncbi:MAG: YCF48-related protein, partial [Gammaproteobacteria bacterium]|nr:YCF48-related protein [Gammaproteobacteria bacterium]
MLSSGRHGSHDQSRQVFTRLVALSFVVAVTVFSFPSYAADWAAQVSGTANKLNDVVFPVDATTGYVVGDSGTLLKTTNGGASWVSLNANLPVARQADQIRSVSFIDNSTGVIAIGAGFLLKTIDGGASWTQQASTGGPLFNAVHLNGTTGLAAGTFGLIYKTTNTGGLWTPATSFPDGGGINYTVFTNSSTSGNVGGYDATQGKGVFGVSTNTFVTWPKQNIGALINVYSLDFPSSTNGFAVGSQGVVMNTTNSGTLWTAQSSGVTQDLMGVNFGTTTTGLAVGLSGRIIKTTNGGTIWTTMVSPTVSNINKVYMVDANSSYIVGDGGLIYYSANGGGSAMIVTTTASSGAGSLRDAMIAATAGSTITFDTAVFPAGAPATIALASALPSITVGAVTIDASDAGVIIDGAGAGAGVSCLTIASNSNVVRGLRIQGCTSNGVNISSGVNNTIGGDNTVGTGPYGQGNLIVSNGLAGIQVSSASNFIYGNRIGSDGAVALANGANGINISAAGAATIGGTSVGLRNIISG